MADIKFRFGYKSYDVYVCVTSWRMRLLHVSYVCGGDGGGGAVLMTEEVYMYYMYMYVCK